MKKPIELSFTGGRRIDLDALEEVVSRQGMRDWMYERFNGQDARLHVDADSMETPDEVFVDLWRRADLKSAVRDSLDRACLALLEEAWGASPADWIKPLLELVATVRPEACCPFLTTIVKQGGFQRGALVAGGWDKRWLRAAAAYGVRGDVKPWADLLGNQRYAAIAYAALAESVETGAWYVPDYYRVLSPKAQPVLLKEALRRLLADNQDAGRTALRNIRERMETVPGLCDAINQAMQELGHPPVYPPTIPSSLGGAATEGRKARELVAA